MFGDRLVDAKDRQFLASTMQTELTKVFPSITAELLFAGTGSQEHSLVFSDFIDITDNTSNFNTSYALVTDKQILMEKIEFYLQLYNNDREFTSSKYKVQPLRVALFTRACELVAKVVRVLKLSQGCCVLIGHAGSGRRTVAQLAAFIAGMALQEIAVTKDTTLKSWRDETGRLILQAGIMSREVTMHFSDRQSLEGAMWEDVCMLLLTGETTSPCSDKDFNEIQKMFSEECEKQGKAPTRINILRMFHQRVREHVHVLITLSPQRADFLHTLRTYPAILKCSTLLQLTEWPKEAYLNLIEWQLADFHPQVPIHADTLKRLQPAIHRLQKRAAALGAAMQGSSVSSYANPGKLVQLLEQYRALYEKRSQQIMTQVSRMRKSIEQLESLQRCYDAVKADYTLLQPSLEKLKLSSKQQQERLAAESEAAELCHRQLVEEEKESLAQEQSTKKLKKQIDIEVKDCLEQMQEALKNVSKIKKEHLSELKSLNAPPAILKLTLTALVIMYLDQIRERGGELLYTVADPATKRKEENYVETGKKYLLNDTKELIEILITFEKNGISQQQMARLQERVFAQKEFNNQAGDRANLAVKYLYLWVQAAAKYTQRWNETEPQRKELHASKDLLQLK